MADIFISHIHEDGSVANALRWFISAKVQPQTAEIFVSSSQLQLGDEWLEKIRISFRSAKIVIALFSPEAVKRPWVNFEAGGAWFSPEKMLIPLCIGGLSPATLLTCPPEIRPAEM